MATKTKKQNIFNVLFASGIDDDVEYYEEATLPEELAKVKKGIEAKEVEIEKGFNSEKPSKNASVKKVDPNTLEKKLEKMREYNETKKQPETPQKAIKTKEYEIEK